MAGQTQLLAELLSIEGARVTLVQVNPPYRPAWVGRFRGVRAVCRLVPYLPRLWSVAGRVELMHVMANSGWSWHLFAAPAIWIGSLRGVPVVVNYRGGEAPRFLARSPFLLRSTVARAAALIVPSGFLRGVFERAHMAAGIVPNVVELSRFHPGGNKSEGPPHVVVARNLEPIYDVASALRAFQGLRAASPGATMTIAGSGQEANRLEALAVELGISDAVRFPGRSDRDAMAELYRSATIVLNPALADNMPNSILEALASGVPVVSTRVGGVPYIVRDRETAVLVAPQDHAAMTEAMLRLHADRELRERLVRNGLQVVQQYAWDRVRISWGSVYDAALSGKRPVTRSSLYTRLVSGVIFPLQERMKRHATVRVRAGLEATQWWQRDELERLQLDRLRRLLADAQAHVPYYRNLFRRLDFDAGAVSSLRDLRRLPFLTKPIIRENAEQLKSERAVGLARFNTGGSTGEPLIFFIGRERVTHDVAAKWRATRWWGVDIGDPEAVVWGSPVELSAQDRLRGLRDALMRTRLLSAFELSESRVAEFVDAIRSMRPRMLFGYPSAIARIAEFARGRGARMDDLGVRVVFVTAERLYDDQRETISNVFGCRVANGYGGRDAGFIAHECPEGGMHVTAEDIVLETVDADGDLVAPGEPGEIVVTHLATGDFPFIRYRTGDVGVLDDRECPCGRGLPLLKEIQGRTTDFVFAADGTVMHGLALIYVLRDLPGISQFKIVQESLDLTRVMIVPSNGFGPQVEATIRAKFRQRLGDEVQVVLERVADIPAERSGKFRYVVSNITPGAGTSLGARVRPIAA